MQAISMENGAVAQVTRVDGTEAMLAATRGYCDRKWKLVPVYGVTDGKCDCGNRDCTSPGKHPLLFKWPERASSDYDEVSNWLRRWPNMNLAVATGSASGIFVVDVDGQDGEQSLNDLQTEFGALPTTLTARTGSGRHLFFRHPGGHVKSNAGMLAKRLDVRGDKGYVLVAPSTHISGVQYEWLDKTAESSEAPAWLIAMVCGDEPVKQSLHSAAQDNAVIEEGDRNNSMFKHACGMRGGGASQAEIQSELRAMNNGVCQPPLPAAEVKQIAASAAKYKPNSAPAITGDDNPLRWFPFDTVSWRRNHHVFAMTAEQVGWYVWLIVECWDRGGYLPSDPALLWKLARAKSKARFQNFAHAVLAEFELSDDESTLVHQGLRAEFETRAAAVEKKRKAGQARWRKGTEDSAAQAS